MVALPQSNDRPDPRLTVLSRNDGLTMTPRAAAVRVVEWCINRPNMRSHTLANGARLEVWRTRDGDVCADLRHVPMTANRRYYFEARDTAQTLHMLETWANGDLDGAGEVLIATLEQWAWDDLMAWDALESDYHADRACEYAPCVQ